MAGSNGGFGKYVEIRHNGIYTSCYGHLSGYGKGIRAGAKIGQGDVVGYVGSTGLATGPHLDFRIKKFGTYVNPLTIDCPRAEPVAKDRMPEFIEARDVLRKALATDSTIS
jgi:murein DD-endopeptidase MepM/ murein hydrolase activator NlpD